MLLLSQLNGFFPDRINVTIIAYEINKELGDDFNLVNMESQEILSLPIPDYKIGIHLKRYYEPSYFMPSG